MNRKFLTESLPIFILPYCILASTAGSASGHSLGNGLESDTDKAGQSSVFKSSLKITTPVEGSPEITITETGEGNSKTAVAGGEMHLEAEISAPNKIAEIEVELHNTAADYEKEFKYTGKYLGETSAHFHEHLAVPADAPTGEYHLHFTVTDADGNSTTEEVEGIQITK